MDAKDIILEPIITEKALQLQQKGYYLFWVAPKANKYQIKQAIEELFAVRVKTVRTAKAWRKVKSFRAGRRWLTLKRVKKAIVELAPGEEISLLSISKEGSKRKKRRK